MTVLKKRIWANKKENTAKIDPTFRVSDCAPTVGSGSIGCYFLCDAKNAVTAKLRQCRCFSVF